MTLESTHPQTSTLLAYFQGDLEDDTQETVEIHLADCDACIQICEQIRALERVWSAWSARAHGDLHLRLTLARALARAEAQTGNASWQKRLRRWREGWAGTAEAALRTLLDVSAGGARAVAAGVEALARPGSAWVFAAEADTAGVWGEGDDDGSAIVVTGNLSPEQPRALVELRGGERGDIVVRVDNLALGQISPLVVLIALTQDREVVVRVTEVEPRAGTSSHVGRFTDLPPGEYIVAFEPLAAAGGPAP